jgi:ketosteroid isomerase-like protein
MAAILGYARVSTIGQDLDAQLAALAAAGVDEDRIYTDKLSGAANTARPGLADLLDYARDGDTVVVTVIDQLPFGELPATGKQMDAPCCDVFELEDGKIKRFDCYPEGSVIFAQLGVLTNLEAALTH